MIADPASLCLQVEILLTGIDDAAIDDIDALSSHIRQCRECRMSIQGMSVETVNQIAETARGRGLLAMVQSNI